MGDIEVVGDFKSPAKEAFRCVSDAVVYLYRLACTDTIF